MLTPKSATGLGKIQAEPVYHGQHALIGLRSRQNLRPSTGGLGKTFGNPFIMAISPEKSGAYAKTGGLRPVLGKFEWEPVYHGDYAFFRSLSRQNRRGVWGNSNGKRFIMAMPPRKSGTYAKTGATFDRLGKIEGKPVYHGDRETNRDPIGETFRIGEIFWIGETRGYGPCRQNDRRQQAPISGFAVLNRARTRPTQYSKPPSFPYGF